MTTCVRRSRYVIVVAALVGLTGCNLSMPMGDARKASLDRWNAARSQVKAALAADQLAAGNVSDARAESEKALALTPEDPKLLTLRARVALAAGDAAGAAKMLETAQSRGATDAETDYLVGVVHQQRLDWDGALEAFVRAAEAEPTELAYFVAAAQTLLQLGKPLDALEYVRSRGEVFGWTPGYEAMLAECHEQLGDWDSAAKAWRRVADGKPDALNRERLATALFRAGHCEEATSLLRELLESEGSSVSSGVRRMYSECLIEQRQYEAARAQLSEILSRSPEDADARLLLARTHAEQGRWDAALKAVRVVLERDRQNMRALEFATALTYRMGRMPHALELARRYRRAAPENESPIVDHVLEQARRMADSPAAAAASPDAQTPTP